VIPRRRGARVLAGLALALACRSPAGDGARDPATSGAGLLPPATFVGEIPCADCPAQRLVLSLRPDGIFLLRRTYLDAADGRDQTFVELGLWSTSPDGTRLELRGGTRAARQLAVRDAGVLRMLDLEGREIVSSLNYDLVRSDRFDPIADPFRMRGDYVYFADAAGFTECTTGRRFPVAGPASLDLERAYLAARGAPGEPLLVTLDGHLGSAPAMEGDGEEEAVIVDRFDRAWPGERCAGTGGGE
jgi:copper homeostasis protein (lipoprotein)